MTRIIVFALLALTLVRAVDLSRPFFTRGWDVAAFYDFRIWRLGIETFQKTGTLYDTDKPGYYQPGSRSLYKYPPTFAALLRPFAGKPQALAGRVFLAGNFVLLAVFLIAVLRALRPGWERGMILGILLINWQGVWESLSDLQMEPILLAMLGLSFLGLRRGRALAAGAPIGVAGAFKVYPWVLGLDFVVRKKWRALLGVAAGAAAALAAACLALPPRLSTEFFFRILPRIGGTSLSYENVSAAAVFGRLAMQLRGALPGAATLDDLVLEQGPAATRAVAVALWLALAVVLGVVAVRALRRARLVPAALKGPIELCLLVCLLMLLIPTSWLSYQALLALPLLAAAGLAPGFSDDRALWVVLGIVILIGAGWNSYHKFYADFPGTVSFLRSFLPLGLFWVLLRILRRWPDAAGGRAATAGAA